MLAAFVSVSEKLGIFSIEDFTAVKIKMTMMFFCVFATCRLVGSCPKDGESVLLRNVGIHRRFKLNDFWTMSIVQY
jgi:hypothetical protein